MSGDPRGYRSSYEPGHADRLDLARRSSLAEQNRKAVRVVAARALDPDDCVALLDMLGLDAAGR